MARSDLLLRRVRRQAKLSQAALARAAGTSQPAVARYEAGLVDPRVETLERLVEACGMRLDIGARTPFRGPVGRLVEENRERIFEACDRHGASRVRVFGSVARGDDREGSDVDLLVDLEPERTLVDLELLQLDLADLLGVPVDVGTEQILAEGVSARVAADLRPL